MKILEQTITKLKIKHISLYHIAGRSMVLGGLACAAFSLSLITTSANLKCQRIIQNAVDCELKRFTTLRESSTTQIMKLSAAKVIEKSPKGYPIYEVVLLTNDSTVSLLAHPGGNEQENQSTVSQINNFVLHSEQKSLSVWHHGKDYLSGQILFLAAFITAGLLLTTSPTITVTFDKSLNRITLERRRVLFRQVQEYPLNEILDVRLQCTISNPTAFRDFFRSRYYRISLMFANSDCVLLSKVYSLLGIDADYFSKQIKRFLSTPNT